MKVFAEIGRRYCKGYKYPITIPPFSFADLRVIILQSLYKHIVRE